MYRTENASRTTKTRNVSKKTIVQKMPLEQHKQQE